MCEAKRHLNTLIPCMRQLRVLGQGVWYEIRTRINNREPLFRRANALAIFAGVFRETELRFVFEVRALRLEDDWLKFYIKPEDGFKLPDIMKWMKQVFAQRFNAAAGRIGHIWGDRYWSRIMEGEPEAEEGEAEPANGDRPRWRRIANGVCPRSKREEGKYRFSLKTPSPAALSPG
jgi:REP element-mobilizing transposase RayT